MTDVYSDSPWQIRITGYYPTKTAIKSSVRKKPSKDEFNPPKHEIDAFARCILPAIQAYFESEKGKKEYAEWCEKQQAQNGKTA